MDSEYIVRLWLEFMNLYLCAVAVTCLLAASGTTAMADSHVDPPLSGTVKIGALVPVTGEAARHGQDIRATLDLAESEINQYLQEADAGWELEIVVEDSAASPVIALEKIAAIKAHGIDLVVGTYSSAELRSVMGYATSNNMLLISYASTAPSLGIPGDKVFRFIPDSTKQAPANARLFEDMGITHVIPFWRGDAWGDGLVKVTKDRVEAFGGVFHDGIRYNPEAIEFSTEVALLSDLVDDLAADGGHDRIGVLLLTFAEGVNIAHSARHYDGLADLEWVGSDTLINVGGPGSDRISSEFFNSQVSITVFTPPENPVHDRVAAHVLETVGREPIVYSLTAYESAWALGLSIYAADSTKPELVAGALPGVLEERRGVLGKIALNDAGDLETSTYEIWQLADNEWIHAGTYGSESDRIVWKEGAPNVESKGEGSDAAGEEEEVAAGDAGDRIDAGHEEGGGCLIATAAFGSELAPQVQFLREVRDGVLLQTNAGSSFMEWFGAFYYLFSPTVADFERASPELRGIVRAVIAPAMYVLGIMAAADPDSETSVVALMAAVTAVLVGMYVMVPVIAAHWTARIIRRFRGVSGQGKIAKRNRSATKSP